MFYTLALMPVLMRALRPLTVRQAGPRRICLSMGSASRGASSSSGDAGASAPSALPPNEQGAPPLSAPAAALVRDELSGLTKPRMAELVLVRHGESEGNVAFSRSVAGDHSLYSGEFLNRHSSFWRLTDRGREQAFVAGEWINRRLQPRFDCWYTSEYLRAMETASLLDLPGARWRPEILLRERDWGQYDLASQEVRAKYFAAEEERRLRDSLFWAPPGGESLAHVIHRVDSLLLFWNRRFANRRVVATCHGELMWAFRMRFERLTQLRYRQMQREASQFERIHNGQVLVYSRRGPTSGALSTDFRWMQLVCPWDLSLSGGEEWRPIERSGGLNSAALWTMAETYPRLFNETAPLSRKDGTDEVTSGLSLVGNLETKEPTPQLDKGESTASSDDAHHDVHPELVTEHQTLHAPSSPRSLELGSAATYSSSPRVAPLRVAPLPRGAKVLLLVKVARWRVELNSRGVTQPPFATADAATFLGAKASWPQSESMRRECEVHEAATEAIANALRSLSFEVVELPIGSCSPVDLHAVDLVCTAGGDGTFLRAASILPTGTAVLPINTDPQRSSGALCAAEMPYRGGAEHLAARAELIATQLREGAFELNRMPRLRAEVEGRTLKPQHALNEILIAESDPSRPLLYEMAVDGEPKRLYRSSGLIASTQLGAGAWLRAARSIDEVQAKALLAAAADAERRSRREMDPAEMSRILAEANDALVRHGDPESDLQYLVREPMPVTASSTSRCAGAGRARRLWVRPLGWHATMFIDGMRQVPLASMRAVSIRTEDAQLWPAVVKLPRPE